MTDMMTRLLSGARIGPELPLAILCCAHPAHFRKGLVISHTFPASPHFRVTSLVSSWEEDTSMSTTEGRKLAARNGVAARLVQEQRWVGSGLRGDQVQSMVTEQ